MRYGTNSRGYTIVEVMIFLAVSGFMFVIAASFISGKQAKAEFKQGMSAMNSEIEQTINGVSDGYYPATTSFKCTANASGRPTFGAPDADTEQGNNQGCVFLGKFIQFGDSLNVGLDGDVHYNIQSIVGRQYASGAADTTELPRNFSTSLPTVAPDITVNKKLRYGLNISKITSGGSDLVGIGFINSFSSYNASSGNLESGAQSVSLVTLPGGANIRNQTASNMTMQIEGLADGNVQANPDVIICFTGANEQFGTITIGGGNGARLATKTLITSGTPPTGC